MARACTVCGLETGGTECPRCTTPVEKERPVRSKRVYVKSTKASKSFDPEAAKRFSAVPGITQGMAEELAGRGFRDLADLVRLALPSSAVEKGLHQAIARKVLVESIDWDRTRSEEGPPCPTCGTPWPGSISRCAVCGAAPDPDLDPEGLERRLNEVAGTVVDIDSNADFRGMPPEVQRELLAAVSSEDEREILLEDGRRQIEAWRRRGLDVAPLERLLEQDPESFAERGARLVQSETMKMASGGRFLCPLCEIAIPSAAEECPNCGAKFA